MEVAEFSQAVSLCKWLIKMQLSFVDVSSFSVRGKENIILISYFLLFPLCLYGRRFGEGLFVREELRPLAVRTRGPLERSSGLMNYVPLSQIHLVPFTKKH